MKLVFLITPLISFLFFNTSRKIFNHW